MEKLGVSCGVTAAGLLRQAPFRSIWSSRETLIRSHQTVFVFQARKKWSRFLGLRGPSGALRRTGLVYPSKRSCISSSETRNEAPEVGAARAHPSPQADPTRPTHTQAPPAHPPHRSPHRASRQHRPAAHPHTGDPPEPPTPRSSAVEAPPPHAPVAAVRAAPHAPPHQDWRAARRVGGASAAASRAPGGPARGAQRRSPRDRGRPPPPERGRTAAAGPAGGAPRGPGPLRAKRRPCRCLGRAGSGSR
jgi:hypothetical protein